MVAGLESISLPAKTSGLLLTSVTQNNIDKHVEERPLKHLPLILSLVFHSRLHIGTTFNLTTWSSFCFPAESFPSSSSSKYATPNVVEVDTV